MQRMWEKLSKSTDTLIKNLLIATVLVILSLSFLSIGLRWFERSLLWIDPLVRHLVLLLTFLGATLAIPKRKHIAIDITHMLPNSFTSGTMGAVREVLIAIFTLGILCWLLSASMDLVEVEKEFGKLEFLNIPSWVLISIFPLGIGLMSWRWFLHIGEILTEVKR